LEKAETGRVKIFSFQMLIPWFEIFVQIAALVTLKPNIFKGDIVLGYLLLSISSICFSIQLPTTVWIHDFCEWMHAAEED